jgi:hypothetical protein
MQVQVKKPETFQPIDLCIKIETQEELALLQILFGADFTVPEVLRSKNRLLLEKDVAKLSNLMTHISSKISE